MFKELSELAKTIKKNRKKDRNISVRCIQKLSRKKWSIARKNEEL